MTEEELLAQEELKKFERKKEKKEEEAVRHEPGTVFTVSYNPKGERYTRPSLDKQGITEALHRDNWGRFQLEYERIFETDTYHLVKDRGSTDIYMLSNNPYLSKSP